MKRMRYYSVVSLVLIVFFSYQVRAEEITVDQNDRVVVGDAYLSTLSKESAVGVQDETLQRKLQDPKLQVIVVQQRMLNGTRKFFVLVVLGKRTNFDKLEITERDYNWLLKLLDRLPS